MEGGARAVRSREQRGGSKPGRASSKQLSLTIKRLLLHFGRSFILRQKNVNVKFEIKDGG